MPSSTPVSIPTRPNGTPSGDARPSRPGRDQPRGGQPGGNQSRGAQQRRGRGGSRPGDGGRGPRPDGGRPETGAAPAPAAPRPAAPPAAAPAPDGASFADLGVPAALVESMRSRGLTTPFPIQTATLRDTLAGRDVLGRGKTGSGKTLAFAIPLVARLSDGAAPASRRAPKRPRALVLAPTRELALQIAATIDPLAQAAGLRTTVIFGGVPQGRQVSALSNGVDVVIACPGRLEDLMRQREIFLDAVEVTVLDEADHMADLGFLPGVTRILTATPRGGQRLLFSATLDNGVDTLVKKFLDQPLSHAVDSAESPVAAMTHHVLAVDSAEVKTSVVRYLASGTGRRLLFMRTKHQAKRLARQLTASGIPAVDLHGNLSQNARQRNLEAFSSGEAKVMVATDIAARGIHVDDVELVIHVDPPTEHKAYLHRSGRTARAGSGGDVVTVMLPAEAADVRVLMRQARITATTHRIDAATDLAGSVVGSLTGEVAPHVDPPANAPAVPAARPETSGRGGRGGGGGRGGQRPGGRGESRGSGARQGGSGGGRAASSGSGRGGSGRGGQGGTGLVYSSTSGSSVGRHPGSGRSSTRG